MLEELARIEKGREVIPDKLPHWYDAVIEIEDSCRRSHDLNFPKFYLHNGIKTSIAETVSGLKVKTPRDIELYIQLFRPLPQELLLETHKVRLCRSEIINCMLNNISADEPLCINGYGAFFPSAFSHLSMLKSMITDDIHSDNMLEYLMLPEGISLAVANCTTDNVLNGLKGGANSTIILANSRLGHIVTNTQFPQNSNVIISNCEYREPKDEVFASCNSYVAVGCTDAMTNHLKGRKIFECCFVDRENPLPEAVESKIYDLGRQMKGKSGLEVYALGKQIVEILKAGERRA